MATLEKKLKDKYRDKYKEVFDKEFLKAVKRADRSRRIFSGTYVSSATACWLIANGKE